MLGLNLSNLVSLFTFNTLAEGKPSSVRYSDPLKGTIRYTIERNCSDDEDARHQVSEYIFKECPERRYILYSGSTQPKCIAGRFKATFTIKCMKK